MGTRFEFKIIANYRAQQVLRVEDFAEQHGLGEKQKRDLLKLFGQFATRQELFSNSQLPKATR